MAAYDAKDDANAYPKMKYKGTDYMVVSSAKEETTAAADGYDADTPSGRISPIGRDVMPKQVAVAAQTQAELEKTIAALTKRVDALETVVTRVDALEAEVLIDDKPAHKKAK